MSEINLNYSPHKFQKQIHDDPARFKVVVAGRRFGKSMFSRFHILLNALYVPGLYWIVNPTYKQGKMIHWRELKKEVPPELITYKNEQELSIELVNGSRIEIKGADNENCYSDDTEVLTNKGWKLFKDLNREEEVLTLNPKTLMVEWQKPIRYIESKYNGDFYHVNSKKMDLMVSLDHRFFVKSRKGVTKFKTISELSLSGDCIPIGLGYAQDNSDISKDDCAFMGIYLSEGTAYGNSGGDITKRRGNYSVFIAQTDGIKGYNGNKGNVKSEIKQLITRLGYNFQDRGDGLEILNKALWLKLLPLGNKYTKRIPNNYKNLSVSKLKVLLDWLIKGDGSINGGKREYFTVSKQLADDIQEICFKAGFASNIIVRPPSDKPGYIRGRLIKSIKPLYIVKIYCNRSSYFSKHGKSYISKTLYIGKMYCLEVPNHTILVRRNGKAIWSGNSLRGVGIKGVVFDETADQQPHVFWDIIRPTLIDSEGWAIFIGTPRGFNWFYELYLKGQKGTKEYEVDWSSYKFTSYDNPHLSQKEIGQAKSQTDEDTFSQEYLAEFKKFKGLIYKNFDRNVHVIEPFEIPNDGSWEVYRGVDFGFDNPTACVWVAVNNEDKKWYVIDEYYETKESSDYHCGIILSKSAQYPSVSISWGDPSAPQVMSDWAKKGLYITPARREGNTNRGEWVGGGIDIIQEKLKVSVMDQKPQLFIFKHCENLIREFESYEWEEPKNELLNAPGRPKKANDHALDALRYFACSYIGRQGYYLPDDFKNWSFT